MTWQNVLDIKDAEMTFPEAVQLTQRVRYSHFAFRGCVYTAKGEGTGVFAAGPNIIDCEDLDRLLEQIH